jgi:hypothetical protein
MKREIEKKTRSDTCKNMMLSYVKPEMLNDTH